MSIETVMPSNHLILCCPLKEQREYYKAQIDALAPGKGQVRVYKKVHEAFDYICKAFIGAKDKNLTMFLESLEDRANDYLRKLNANDFHGIVKLIRTADDSAVIKLYSKPLTKKMIKVLRILIVFPPLLPPRGM